jgi:hypothetical protein
MPGALCDRVALDLCAAEGPAAQLNNANP